MESKPEAEAEAEAEQPFSITTTQLSLLQHSSPDPPGTRTPPLYTMASVPFRWEEEPGKPRPCTTLIPFPNSSTQPKSLELPPCRLLIEPPPPAAAHKITYKTLSSPSPTTVLDGPYSYFTAAATTRTTTITTTNNSSKFTSASFRFFRERQGSFDDSTGSGCTSPEKGQLSTVVLAHKLQKGRAFFGSWRKISINTPNPNPKPCNGEKEVVGAGTGGSSFVHPSSSSSSSEDAGSFWSDEGSNNRVKITKVRRNGSFSSLSHARPQFWATVFKQVIPWKKSRKSKKESII